MICRERYVFNCRDRDSVIRTTCSAYLQWTTTQVEASTALPRSMVPARVVANGVDGSESGPMAWPSESFQLPCISTNDAA